MTRPPLPVAELEREAAELFMAGASEDLVVRLSIAVSLRRIADGLAEIVVEPVVLAGQVGLPSLFPPAPEPGA